MVKKTLVSKISTMMENAISNFYLNHGFSKAFPSFHGKNKTIVFCRFSPKKNHPLTMDLRRPPGRCPPRTWRPRTWRTWPRPRWPPTRPRPQGANFSQWFRSHFLKFCPITVFFPDVLIFFDFSDFPRIDVLLGRFVLANWSVGRFSAGHFNGLWNGMFIIFEWMPMDFQWFSSFINSSAPVKVCVCVLLKLCFNWWG